MKDYFSFDHRLGIPLPDSGLVWNEHSIEKQHEILFQWERIRGAIPDRIFELENQINQKQALLSNESDFPYSCHLNTEIAGLASIINDLLLWYRANQVHATKPNH
ncbi:MAG: hypothetical protein K6T88_00595 [Bacillus sp. (in: Bacteria)]|nr:hypothetical protein [Bacillus sp. (in: firmicutes)]